MMNDAAQQHAVETRVRERQGFNIACQEFNAGKTVAGQLRPISN